MKKPFLAIVLMLMAMGNAHGVGYPVEKRFDKPLPERFTVCYRHSCRSHIETAFSKAEWQEIRSVFSPAAKTAEEERLRIKRVISMIEKVVGPKTGTDVDLPGTFLGSFQQGQMDCIDEAMNTATYLTMLLDAGLLHFHELMPAARRGMFISGGGWAHSSAVVRDIKSGKRYAVDSWFYENGKPPEILPLEAWLQGWNPEPNYRPKRFVPLDAE